MSRDKKEDDELDSTPDEIQDLDVRENEGEEIKGGIPARTSGCTCSGDCISL